MHVPDHRPSCWTGEDPRTLPPRVDWSIDGAASCQNAADEPEWERTIRLTPGCEDCSRAARAVLIESGVITPHPKRPPKPASETHIGGRR